MACDPFLDLQLSIIILFSPSITSSRVLFLKRPDYSQEVLGAMQNRQSAVFQAQKNRQKAVF